MTLQNMPLWHVGCFGLKAVKTRQTLKALWVSLNCLKEFRQGPLQEITFYLKDLSTWQGKHLITEYFLFLSSCEWLSSPLKLQIPLSSGQHIILNCPTCPWVSLSLWCSQMYKIKFVSLLLTCLMSFLLLDQPKNLVKKKGKSYSPTLFKLSPTVATRVENGPYRNAIHKETV